MMPDTTVLKYVLLIMYRKDVVSGHCRKLLLTTRALKVYRTYETISAPHDVDQTQPNSAGIVQSKWLHQTKEHLIAFRAVEEKQGTNDKYCRRTGSLSRQIQLLICRTTFWDKCESCAFGFPWCARGIFRE